MRKSRGKQSGQPRGNHLGAGSVNTGRLYASVRLRANGPSKAFRVHNYLHRFSIRCDRQHDQYRRLLRAKKLAAETDGGFLSAGSAARRTEANGKFRDTALIASMTQEAEGR
jgi:hypothetical protein